MKTCPICKATCFDDMEVCYGCLHRFNAEPSLNIPAIDPPLPVQQQTVDSEEPRGRHRMRESAPIPEHSNSRVVASHACDHQSIPLSQPKEKTVEQSTALVQHNDLPNWIPLAVLGGGQDGIAMSAGQNKNGTAMQYRLVLGLQPVQV